MKEYPSACLHITVGYDVGGKGEIKIVRYYQNPLPYKITSGNLLKIVKMPSGLSDTV